MLTGVFASGCGRATAPSPPPPPTNHPTVTISGIAVAGARTAGYEYRTVVHLKESAGVSATIVSIDLAFMAGTTQLASSHFDRPISDAANVIPASGTISTRELVTTDVDPSHAYALAVRATVAFSDGTGYTASSSNSADVPPLPSVPPQTYSLTGVITDAGTRAPIAGAQVAAINGANVGKNATTNTAGTYEITDLVGETFRLRASASGYNSGEQNVTVPANARADFELRPIVQACSYSVTPAGSVSVGWGPGSASLTVVRTSGDCAWQASVNVGWITLGASSGSGTASLPFSYLDNPTFVGRSGTIAITWDGGGAQVQVLQNASPPICVATLTINGENPAGVPASGGQFVALVKLADGVPAFVCGSWTATADPASQVAIVGLAYGPSAPGAVTIEVQPNTTHAVRSMFVTMRFERGQATLTINQAAAP